MDPVRLERSIESTRQHIAALLGRVIAAKPALDELKLTLSNASARALEDAKDSMTTSVNDSALRAQRTHEEEGAVLLSAISDRVGACAPASWGSAMTEVAAHQSGPGAYCRIGTYDLSGRSVPALLPLFSCPGWMITAEYDQAAGLIGSVVARAVAEIPLASLRLTVFDPRLRGGLGEFTQVRKAFAAAFPAAVHDGDALSSRLDSVLADAAGHAERVVASGAQGGERVESPSLAAKANVVVLLDFPAGLGDSSLRKLIALTSATGSTGTVVLAHRPPGSTVTSQQRLVLDELIPLTRDAVGWRTPSDPDGHLVLSEPPPTGEVIGTLVSHAHEANSGVQGVTIGLESLIAADLEKPWSASAKESLDAVIGVADGAPLRISLRTENPAQPNVLLGGAVGQGKSNLVLALVYALAVRYSPAELELYLLDFKQGLEFRRFDADEQGEGWLPHVRALGLESSQEFGLAVLRHVEAEMVRRAALFKAVGVTRIDAYREAGPGIIARIVLVVDEFQVLFDGDDDGVDEAVSLLERLARQGRAYGIHVVLASQTVSGLRALATRGDAIFAQFPIRVSLKNTGAESQAILGQGNTAAADLAHRGEVVVNRNFGNDPAGSNMNGAVAFADPDVFGAVQRRLWDAGHGPRPTVFVGSLHADWDRRDLMRLAASRPGSEDVELLLGRPIALTEKPYGLVLTDDVDQAVAVVGPSLELARAVLESAMTSVVVGLGAGARITVLDAASETTSAWFVRLADLAAKFDVHVDVVARDGVRAALLGPLLDELNSGRRGAGLLLALGLQRARGMDQAEPLETPEDPYMVATFDEPVTARSILRRWAVEGAMVGRPLVGWWPNLRATESDLGQALSGVRAFVTTDLGSDDLRSLCGPLARRPQGSPRVGVVDRASNGSLEVVVPFGPYRGGDPR